MFKHRTVAKPTASASMCRIPHISLFHIRAQVKPSDLQMARVKLGVWAFCVALGILESLTDHSSTRNSSPVVYQMVSSL